MNASSLGQLSLGLDTMRTDIEASKSPIPDFFLFCSSLFRNQLRELICLSRLRGASSKPRSPASTAARAAHTFCRSACRNPRARVAEDKKKQKQKWVQNEFKMSSKWVQWFHPGQRNQSLHGLVGRWLAANGSCKHWDRQRPTSERFAVRALISSGVAWQVPFFCKDASSSFIRTGILNLGMRSVSRLSVCLLASAGSDRGHQPDWPCRPSTLNIQRVLIIYMHKLVVSRMSMWGTTKSG